ncbi:MAG: DUF1848 family protein [Desulfobacterales bacterium]|nr:MAG: DUF1848 family protein [Desulfobacterales bacterium]
MPSNTPIVISASRRTDIPAFYMPWFTAQIEKGYFEVVNPYNRRVSNIPATPDAVHTIVFWSKNFGPFLKNAYGPRLQAQGYHLFFNFTVNSDSTLLEPRVPPLKDRLPQLKALCDQFGARTINWRFDPICFFKTPAGAVANNLQDFVRIASQAAKWGITRCITSFVDDYAKIRKRLDSWPGLAFIDPPLAKKKEILLKMEQELGDRGIRLSACCERELIEALPADSTVTPSACIPNDFLVEIFGGQLSLKKDAGQRAKAGCGCKVSIDIGSYHQHPCYHNCLFCYANPASGPIDHPRGVKANRARIGFPKATPGNRKRSCSVAR